MELVMVFERIKDEKTTTTASVADAKTEPVAPAALTATEEATPETTQETTQETSPAAPQAPGATEAVAQPTVAKPVPDGPSS